MKLVVILVGKGVVIAGETDKEKPPQPLMVVRHAGDPVIDSTY
ncbi:hypothetical protein [Bacillus sp. BHET2]|nr:hypothetical protein [Bacillus sp. BHET2]